MDDYIKIEFEFLSKEEKEIVIALLIGMNYEGFEEEGDLLKAYTSSLLYNEAELRKLMMTYGFMFSVAKIENKNWNKEWESSFQPVIIKKLSSDTPFAGIRADFHEPIKNVQHEIIITPKMSFGTGHHATTFMMMQMMSELDFKEKKVLDFGTGTGILAILSEKLGALNIIAIDYDDHSINNAADNFDLNNCSKIKLMKGSSADGDEKFDLILANIIKTVILANLDAFVKQLAQHGVILLSGLLQDDEMEIVDLALPYNLILKNKIRIEDWICLQMMYKPPLSKN